MRPSHLGIVRQEGKKRPKSWPSTPCCSPCIGLLSIVIPIGIFIDRTIIRATHGQLVEGLARLLFSFGGARGESPLIVPSF